MKNILLIAAALLATTVLCTDTAVAGGGKGKSKVAISNTNPVGGRAITVWVISEDQAGTINTVGDARRLPHRNVQAGRVETFHQKNGNTVVIAADTAGFNSLPSGNVIPPGGVAVVGPFKLDRDLTGFTFTRAGPPTYTPSLNLN